MNRHIAIAALIGLCVPFILALQRTNSGDPIQAISVVQPKCPWTQVADLADPNSSFGVDDREFSSIVAVTTGDFTTYTAQTETDPDPHWAVWKVPTDARTVQFIATTDADGDDAVVEVWGCAGRYINGTSSLEAGFQLGTTITWKGGTQVGPDSNVYCDTATTSDATLITVPLDSGNDRIAVVTVNVAGMDAIAFLGTTVDSSVQILARWGN